jgi:hypothetical protein
LILFSVYARIKDSGTFEMISRIVDGVLTNG